MRHFKSTFKKFSAYKTVFNRRFLFSGVIIICCALLSSIVSIAQNKSSNWCGTDDHYEYMLKNDPSLALKRAKFEKNIRTLIENSPVEKNSKKTLRIIPTVVHVIHMNGSENISKQLIEDGIKEINDDYQRLNADTTDTRAIFLPYATDMELEFRLAKIDPIGNCTEGIVRVYSELTNVNYSTQNSALKSLSHWPENKYFNIWILRSITNSIGSQILGYAQFPGSGLWSTYGFVNVYFAWGIGDGTASHEMGHCFNLYHTFQNWGDQCGDDCSNSGDYVCDTPPTYPASFNFNCNNTQNSCSNDASGAQSVYTTDVVDQTENFMSYDLCQNMFTIGQKQRVDAALTFYSQLINLYSNSNLITTGTNDGYTAPPCAPIADFNNNFDEGCEGIAVLFNDKSYGADVDSTWTWTWSFPGGDPSASNLQNPSVTYNSFGVYGATMIVSNISGSDTISKTDLVKVKPVTGETASFTEGIENSTFPTHPTDARKDWDIVNPTGDPDSWQRTTTASFSGSASAVIKNQYILDNSVHSLISPAIDMSNIISSAYLTFKLAYSQRTSATNDNLKVYVSTNCGLSWALKYTKTGSLLSSTGTTISSPFIPDTSQWKDVSINLNTYIGQSNVRIKFQMTSDLGNYLYIDDISIDGTIAPFSATISSSTDATCNNACDGMAVVKAVGGIYTYPYSYQWSDGQTNDSATALCAGTYIVFVTDSIGDNTSATVVISEPANVSVTIATTGATCSGCNDGTATATVNGGSGSYSYLWINDIGNIVSTSAIASELTPGTYVVSVTDSICNETVIESAVIIVTSIQEQFENNNFKIYPNPFENNAILSFKLVSRNNISIKVFDVLGRKVGNLEKNNLKAGEYQYNFNKIVNTPVPGLYFLNIIIGEERITRKIICNRQ